MAVSSSFAANKVKVGAYVNDIQNIDLKTHSYTVDLYLWFKWTDPTFDPSTSFEFTNPFESWGHTKELTYEKPEKLGSGEFYQVVRVQGRFSQKLPLYDYPFDRQNLVVSLENTMGGTGHIEFILDENPLAVNKDLQIPGFQIGRVTLSTTEHSYPTNFGDSRVAPNEKYSRIVVNVPITRSMLTYALKLIFPTLCVMLSVALIFFLSPMRVDARVGIGITALLTLVALQMTLNEELPEIDYMMLMDKIYLAGYLFVIGVLAVVIRSARYEDRGERIKAERIDRLSLKTLTPLYLLAVVCILLRVI